MEMAIFYITFFIFVCLLVIITAQPEFRYAYCFNNLGNYTANSTYHANLNTVLKNLSSNTKIDYGFYNFSYGQNSDKVSAIGLCRGDVKPDDCRSCLNNSRILLPRICPNQKQAMGGYDECMLRYSNQSILGGVLDSGFSYYLWNVGDAIEWDKYSAVVSDLLDKLRSKAAAGDSLCKFAAANATGPNFQTIFAAVQCTPDLSEQQCSNCLTVAFSETTKCCQGKRGGRVIKPSCNFRFENFRFYDPTADATTPALAPLAAPPPLRPPSPPSANTISPEGKSNNSRTVIAIVVPIVAFVVLFIFIYIYFRQRKLKITIERKVEADDGIKHSESFQVDFDTIRAATDNFSDANKLGQGGFGAVYKGRLPNGQEIAVKRLSMNSGQGDSEFKNEVFLVAKLQHRNLVRLLGFSVERRERLLIYDFVPNKSLDYFIFDPSQRVKLDWKKRYKIIGGIIRGLVYLHEDSQLKIIHRDLKASNILLDEEMNPKISDFGMAKLFLVDQSQAKTRKIVGTYGYMAPEYAMHGQFSIKSDVYSFGVLVLEVVSGQKNSSFQNGENAENLLSFAWKNWRQGTASNIVDPAIRNGSRSEIMRCIHMGLLCVQEKVARRPTMTAVALMLNSYSLSLPAPTQPAFFINSRNLPVPGASRSSEPENNSVQASENEASITELYPR